MHVRRTGRMMCVTAHVYQIKYASVKLPQKDTTPVCMDQLGEASGFTRKSPADDAQVPQRARKDKWTHPSMWR